MALASESVSMCHCRRQFVENDDWSKFKAIQGPANWRELLITGSCCCCSRQLNDWSLTVAWKGDWSYYKNFRWFDAANSPQCLLSLKCGLRLASWISGVGPCCCLSCLLKVCLLCLNCLNFGLRTTAGSSYFQIEPFPFFSRFRRSNRQATGALLKEDLFWN